MRRKSTRNAAKSTPEKPEKTEPSPKTRRSRRRKRSPSKSSESEEEVAQATKRPEVEATPDTTTKSHSPSDEEGEEAVWKVTSSEDAPRGEIQKLKICLTRPSPDSPDKSRSRRSNSQTEDDATSSEDKSTSKRRTRSSIVKEDEDGKGKGKSKGKHKSKIDKEPHISEPELQTNSEISENAQVTPQSPSIDKPVDNENDCKVDDDDKIVTRGSVEEETRVSNNSQNNTETLSKIQSQDSESDDEPLSVIQKVTTEEKLNESLSEETCEPTKNIEQQPQQEIVEETTSESKETTPEAKETTPQSNDITPQFNETVKENDNEQTNSETLQPMEIQTEEKEEAKSDTIYAEPSSLTPVEAVVEESEEIITSEKPEEKIESQTEKQEIVVQEESTETSSKQDAIPLPEEKIEESNSTKDNDEEKTKSLTEAPSEVQVTSPKLSPTEASETPEKAPSERISRRRLNRDVDFPKPDSQDKEPSESTGPIKPSKIRRAWGGDSQLTLSLVKIDLEAIQSALPTPTIDFPEEPDLKIEVEKERRRSTTESSKKLDRKVSVEYKSDGEKPPFEKQTSVSSVGENSEDNSNIIAFNRKISIVDDTASKLRPPPSPAKNPVSNVLYITNLVRPFTIKQLKELLERTGKIKEEEGFWTDRIKSKCYVQYETSEEAEATRNALHGVQWPIGNGKNLIIDYATIEDLQNAKNPPVPPPVAPPVDTKTAAKENLEPPEEKLRNEEKILKEAEKKRKEGPVREWDIGKKDLRRDRSRSRERSRKHRRSPSPSDDFITRKQRKAEESVPQKLMDDLFLKTKATPSIYWQPLSPEEISMKQQQRLIRMEEHKRRMEETSRMKVRDAGRGAFRRRYE